MTVRVGSAIRGADDTIVAEATMPGLAALAIVRMSGPSAHTIARRVAERWPVSARQTILSPLHDATGALLDAGILVRYDAPASFTGEDSVELTIHGGAVVPATVLAALIEAGARQAEPGEFTRRAVLNGRLDVLQAEAIGDLVAATSMAGQQLALRQLDGGLSRRLTQLRERMIGLEALIAYDIDFPEEDDGPVAKERILGEAVQLERELRDLIAGADRGELVRQGALVVLAGVPNAGKSSLFNALIGQRRAIVTEHPGTTRDAIEVVIQVGRWPIRLVDTAGLRDSNEPIERMGIEVSHEYLRRAVIVLACGATTDEIDRVTRLTTDAAPSAIVVPIHTKADLGGVSGRAATSVSAQTGAGLDAVGLAMTTALESRVGQLAGDAPVLTRVRHRVQATRALEEVRAFRAAWDEETIPAVVAAVHLRAATGALEELIGRVDVDSILDDVFSKFCVGK